MLDLKRIIKDKSYRAYILDRSNLLNWMSDKKYLEYCYKAVFGKPLDLNNPLTFNEKLQWLKLYNRKSEYTKMVDKYSVKGYVSDTIGKEYVIPTLGVWDSFDEIEFDKLPNKFVLKCTHDSGGIYIVRDKNNADLDEARKILTNSLKSNYFLHGREWPYKDVPRRIIAEKYMKDELTEELRDYKIFCFDGKAKFLYLSEGLSNHATARISFINLNWEKETFRRTDYSEFESLPDKPAKFNEMIELAEKLSANIPHVRVDFYYINDEIYFGELTFFTCSGYVPFDSYESDLKIGNYINLPCKKIE